MRVRSWDVQLSFDALEVGDPVGSSRGPAWLGAYGSTQIYASTLKGAMRERMRREVGITADAEQALFGDVEVAGGLLVYDFDLDEDASGGIVGDGAGQQTLLRPVFTGNVLIDEMACPPLLVHRALIQALGGMALSPRRETRGQVTDCRMRWEQSGAVPDEGTAAYALREAVRAWMALVAGDTEHVSDIEWRDLERMVAEALRELGFGVVLMPGSQDGGKDVVVSFSSRIGPGLRAERTYYVQVKHWKSGRRVGQSSVRELVDVTMRDGVDGSLLLSTSGFTDPGKREVRGGAHLVDADWLQRLCRYAGGALHSGMPVCTYEEILSVGPDANVG